MSIVSKNSQTTNDLCGQNNKPDDAVVVDSIYNKVEHYNTVAHDY